MRPELTKRDPHVGILDGRYAFSNDLAEFREGLLMQAEFALTSFADVIGTLLDAGFLSHADKIGQQMQMLYDQLMQEYNTYVQPTDDTGRFVLALKPMKCRYTPPGESDEPKSTPVRQKAA